MQITVIELIEQYGYAAIALLILIENIFPPIPSEVVLAFGGFLTVQTQMEPWLVIGFATLGSVAGAVILYLIGRQIPKAKLEQLLAGKAGRVLHLKAENIGRAEKWFRRYECRAVLLCRCVPVVRSLISVPAGMERMAPLPFLLLTALGSGVWNTALVWLGAAAGDAWEASVHTFGRSAAVAVLLLAGGAAGWSSARKKKKTASVPAAKTEKEENRP